jgi:LmbE family N-acetylglucosaminyl deacetylase
MTSTRLVLLAAVVPWLAANRIDAQSPAPRASADQSAIELSRLVSGLTTTARVLVVGMHPDDESSPLITWLTRARHIETAYLSITRGEAGANLGGGESGNSLGAIRTEELLAERRVDGAAQYFTRAYDFGGARTADDVLKRWNRDSIVGDIVAVIRSFRPQVIVVATTDSVRDRDGQQQALGPFMVHAFLSSNLASRFPVRPFGAPWPVWRLYEYGHGFRVNLSGFDRATGKTFAELAIEARARHRSQGLGDLFVPTAPVVELHRMAVRAGDSEANDASLFSEVDTSFARLVREAPETATEALAAIPAYADSARRALDLVDPAAAVPFLAQVVRLASSVRAKLPWCRHPSPTAAPPVLSTGTCDERSLDVEASIDQVSQRASDALLAAAGVSLQATADRDLVAGDDSLTVAITISNHGSLPATLLDLAGSMSGRIEPIVVAADSSVHVEAKAGGLADPHPWWIGPRGGKARGGDRFGAMPAAVDGLLRRELIPEPISLLAVAIPENIRRTSDATATLTVAGATVTTSLGPIVHRYADASVGLQNRAVAGVPNVTLQFARGLEWIPRGKPLTRSLRVAVKSHSDREQNFALRIVTPSGMPKGVRVDSLPKSLRLAPREARELFVQLRGIMKDTSRLAVVLIGIPPGSEDVNNSYQTGLQVIQRDYLPPIRLLPVSGEWIQPIDISVPPNLSVLYIPGGIDDMASALRQVGVWAQEVESADQLLSVDLSKVTTIAVGARAFDVHPELLGQAGRLVEFVRKGGTLVVLRGGEPTVMSSLFPYPLALASPVPEQVVQADGPVAVLDASARVLSWPNKIVAADWEQWVGERAQLMPSKVDPRYASPVEIHDTGERENRSAILSARVGKGTIVYTTLTLEQQIAGGVPGGLRLFVNLLSAGLARR